MLTVRALLKGYNIDDGFLSETAANGKIEKVIVNKEKRTVNFTVRFSDIVDREELRALENVIIGSDLQLFASTFYPVFDVDFKVDYYPNILKEVCRRILPINKIVSDSVMTLNEDATITIELFHGGKSCLEKFNFDKELLTILRDEFGFKLFRTYRDNSGG